MNKKTLLIILVIVIVVALGLIIYQYIYILPYSGYKAGTEVQEGAGGEISPESQTRTQVPENVTIPEVGEEVPEGVAAPTVVTPAAPEVESKFRGFDIKAEGNKFDPNTVIVELGDTVHINFTAVDKDYDISLPDYGMKQIAPKGQTKPLEFQAVIEGKFTYYCELCGGLDSTAKGYIIVIK